MRYHKFSTLRVATALALSLCVNVISYAGTDAARIVTTMVKLSKKFSQKAIVFANGPKGIKGQSSSGK